MKKYQLIGIKNVLNKRSRPHHSYPSIHICNLPLEILLYIFSFFQNLDLTSLINMAKTCRTFKTIIYKHVLYARMVFPTMHSFQKYTEYHLPHLGLKFQLTAPSDCVNYLQSVVLVNPPVRPRKDMGTNIAGSYIIDDNDCDIKRSGLSYEDFLRSFNAILKEAYGLKSITINEISPHFAFPDTWDDDKGGLSKFRKRGQKMKKTLNKLQLSTQSGWTVPFRLGHISGILA